MNHVLEVKNICKFFQLGKTKMFGEQILLKAVNDVSFKLYEGETLGIIGESGCGKSTLGRCIVNLYNTTSGQIFYNEPQGEINLTQASERVRQYHRRNIQIIFQDPFASLNPRINIFETIAEPLIVNGFRKEEINQRVAEIIEEVGLRKEHLRRFPHSFSGGQRQRIGIARALVVGPKIVICDEAVSALDVSVQAQIINLLKKLQEKNKFTYIFISHDMSVINHICDRIAVMYAGKIVEIGEKKDVLKYPKHPYTEALIGAIPKLTNRKNKIKRKSLAGEPPDLTSNMGGCYLFDRCSYRSSECKKMSNELLNTEISEHKSSCIKRNEVELTGL